MSVFKFIYNERKHVLNLLKVSYIQMNNNYSKPLEGVIFCLDTYSEIDNNVWRKIVNLFEEGKIV